VKKYNYIGWGFAGAMVIVCVILINDINKLKDQRIEDLRIERREKQALKDSLTKAIRTNTKREKKRLREALNTIDSLNTLYNESKQKEEIIRITLRDYLDASDSERLAKFRDLISEVY
jgi:hypothetical protein